MPVKPGLPCVLALLAYLGCNAHACSYLPPDREPPPVLGRFNYPPSDATAPIHLPANAAGVIFLARTRMHEAEFLITKSGSRRRLPVKLTALRSLVPDVMPSPRPPYLTDDVTALRVGPREGFNAGSAYKIKTSWAQVDIVIDHGSVDLKNRKVRVFKAGTRNREHFFEEDHCGMFYGAGFADYQAYGYKIPNGLLAYRDRIYSGGLRRVPGDHPYTEKHPYVRFYLSAIDSEPAGYGLRNGVHSSMVSREPEETRHEPMVTHYAFFEVDDTWHATNVIDLAPGLATLTQNDNLDFLLAAVRSKDIGRLKMQLAALPVRDTGCSPAFVRRMDPYRGVEASKTWLDRVSDVLADWRYQRRHRRLMEALTKLVRHPDPAIRIAAIRAIGRVSRVADPDALVTRKLTRALHRSMIGNDVLVKAAARDTLSIMAAGNHLE